MFNIRDHMDPSEWGGHLFSGNDGFDQVVRHQALCRRIIAANLPARG